MSFNSFILRRLVSLLQPWLPEDSDLQLQLGLVRSVAIAKNLHLNISAFNELLEDTSGSISFNEVIIEHLGVSVSHWPIPAFQIELRGVHVRLSVREFSVEEHSRRKRKSNITLSEILQNKLAAIDPEGVTLHDIMKNFLDVPPRFRLNTAFTNLLLKRCCVKIFSLNLDLKFPIFNNIFGCSLSLNHLNAESENQSNGCLLHELINAVFKPSAHSCFIISGYNLEIVLRGDGPNTRFLNSVDLFSCCKFCDLQLVDMNLRIPELSLSISPMEVFLYSALSGMSSKAFRYSRNGRQLWELAARRISQARRVSLHHFVTVTRRWIQYVNAYELLLLLTGYPADNLMKKFTYKLSRDRKRLNTFKENWMTILDIEKKLPMETIAQARRIARYRAGRKVKCAEDIKEPFRFVQFFYVISSLLLYIWKLVSNMFFLMKHWIVKISTHKQQIKGYLEMVPQDSNLQFSFMLNIGGLLVSISPLREIQSLAAEKLESKFGNASSYFHFFYISIDTLLVVYTKDLCEQSFLISCGQLNVASSPFMESSISRSNFIDLLGSLKEKEYNMGRANDLKLILWSEPALSFLPSDTRDTNVADFGKVGCNLFLIKYLGEMWLRWKSICLKVEESGIKYLKNPWLLCEFNNSLTKPVLHNSNTALLEFNLTFGKLNVALGCSSILSAYLMLQMMRHHAYCWTENKQSPNDLSCAPETVMDQREVFLNNKYESRVSQMMMPLLKKLPPKHIQVAIYIAGPHIHMEFERESSDGYELPRKIVHNGGPCIAFDIHDIEIAVCPASSSDLVFLIESCESDDEVEDLCLKEPHIPTPDKEKYTSQGLISFWFYLKFNGFSAYMVDSDGKQQNQIFFFNRILILSSFVRKYIQSFCENVNAFSMALRCTTPGFTALSYMEDLYLFTQVIGRLSSVISYLDSASWEPGEFVTQDIFIMPKPKFVYAEKASIICSDQSFIHGIFKIKSVDVILHNSWASDTFNTCNIGSNNQKMEDIDFPDCGIWISVHQGRVEVTCEEEKLDILTDASEILSIIFRYQNSGTDHSVSKYLLMQSLNCYYQISLSGFVLTLSLSPSSNASSSGELENIFYSSFSRNNELNMEDSSMTANLDGSDGQSVFVQALNIDSTSTSSNLQLLANVGIRKIFITRCSMHDILVELHQPNKLLSSLFVGGEFQMVSWKLQGGVLFLETKALVFFINCFKLYSHAIRKLLSSLQFSDQQDVRAKQMEGMTRLEGCVTENIVDKTPDSFLRAQGKLLRAFMLDVSEISLVLVIENESGVVREFVIEVDAHINFELANTGKKLVANISRLSIISQGVEKRLGNNIQIPHFSLNSSSYLDAAESASGSKHGKGVQPNNASSSKQPVSSKDFSRNNRVNEDFCLSNQKYMLKSLVACLSVEKVCSHPMGLSKVWAGNGSVSKLDLTWSHTEIRMIMLSFSSFSGLLDKEKTNGLHRRQWSSKLELDGTNTAETFSPDVETIIPDGAIVAIQDIHQHMYFSVEGDEKYNLVGAMHYSLLGDRALFRVKFRKKTRWPSPVLWFSLISLYAKNAAGKQLRLNCCPGSGVVDISGIDDRDTTLWKTISRVPENKEGDMDWESYNQLARRTFYLVNKYNDCAIAFVDGVPEFVGKPGSPFKFKIFHDFSTVGGAANLDHLAGTSETSRGQNSHSQMDERISGTDGIFPCIDISIESISLTIAHEISDTNDTLPLIHGGLSNMQLTLQILANKTRVISTSKAMLNYFDAQRNLWQGLLNPVDFCLYYRFNAKSDGTEAIFHSAPVHIYCRVKELDVSLNEVSLDIILFVIGKLDLAGPFSVRSSIILPNCCKVENRLGVDLLCHFHKQQSLTIGRFQSASLLLRHSDSSDQPLESASFISIQLAGNENFTSPINISQFHAQAFAWRTRIISVKDSRTFPGPLIVVDISRHPEDGLLIVVSPVTMIHNDTGHTMELRFRRQPPKDDECASLLLKPGDVIDDSMAMFDALSFSGGLRKALTSLSVGNFFLSFRPELMDDSVNFKKSWSVEWSDDFKGEKAVRLSGIFDKLSFRVRKVLLVGSEKYSFSTASCKLMVDGVKVNHLHFLIHCIGRDVPIMWPDESGHGLENSHSPDMLQEQRQIFLLPTVRVFNLLYLEIHVHLNETDSRTINEDTNIGKQATISSGSAAEFYANPAIIFFSITLTSLGSTCKPVNSGDFVKKLLKQKNNVHSVDIDLDFDGGKYFACLRLARGQRGTLEATIFTPYALNNNTDFMLYFLAPNKKTLPRDAEENSFWPPPHVGLCLPPNTTRSWFLKSKKVFVQMLESYAFETLLDLDALSGFTELSLQTQQDGVIFLIKFGVSLGFPLGNMILPSQVVTIVPRYVVINESKGNIIVRQCYLQNDMGGTIQINSKQKVALKLQDGSQKPREFSLFDNFVKKHRQTVDDSLKFIQFRTSGSDLSWSSPVCIASLGRFYLKFKKQLDQGAGDGINMTEFAAVHVVEEGPTISLHFHKPPNTNLPYRIENCLHDASITYYQKDVLEPEVLGSQCSVNYVWDDLTLPHKLVVLMNESLVREINLDKLRTWKPLYKTRLQEGLAHHFHWEKNSGGRKTASRNINGRDIFKVGYEIYADGPTRVLRICENSDCHHNGHSVIQSSAKIQLRISNITVHLLECLRQDGDAPAYVPVVAARLGDINLDSVFAEQQKFNQITLQSLSLDEKRVGAAFAAILRRHQVDNSNDCVLKIVCVLNSTSLHVKQVKYLSVVLQPIDLNLDEETLMRIASFWRTSLSDSKSSSQQYYFNHFEIHPIKIVANFLPWESYSSYSSTQDTLRTLLHTVVKIPPMKNMVVELNGVLVTHALITMRELLLRCVQHYSWYAMRAIYIAKGSPLLPPDFISMFDDLASSSLDVFFDPSRGFMNLPGLTLGTFKFIRKCIDGKRLSGTKRYFGDLGKTLRTAGSNVLFAALTEVSDSVLKGAEASGFKGMVSGFHQGILKIAMEPSLLGSALMEGGPDRKIKLDRSPGVDELYIEGYLQAMLDTMYRQEYLRVRVIDNQVILKSLPPNTSLINEIMENVKGFLVSKSLLKGDPSTTTRPFHHLRRESEWKVGPTVRTLCEHLFVSFVIRMLRKGAKQAVARIPQNKESKSDAEKSELALIPAGKEKQKGQLIWSMGIGKFIMSGMLAYIDGRLCRNIPHPIARRIVSGFLLSLLDSNDNQ